MRGSRPLGALRIVLALRHILRAFYGKVYLAVVRDVQDAHLHRLPHLDVLIDVAHKRVCDLGDVHKSALTLRQRHKNAKLRYPSHLTLKDSPNFQRHKLILSV